MAPSQHSPRACGTAAALAQVLILLALASPARAAIQVSSTVNVYESLGRMAADFVGLAHEWNVLWQLGHPSTLDLLGTLKDAEPGGPLSVRIGGLTSDDYGVNPKKYKKTPFARPPEPLWNYVRAFQQKMNAKFMVGVDFFHQSAYISNMQINDALKNLPRSSIVGIEPGNEPNYYITGAFGRKPRKKNYIKGSPSKWITEVKNFLPKIMCGHGWSCKAIPLIGPAWGSIGLKEATLLEYIEAVKKFKLIMITVHWYSIGGKSDLLSSLRNAKAKAAYLLEAEDQQPEHTENLANLVRIAHKNRLKLRVGESNTISDCGGGSHGVTDGFVAAIWHIEMALRVASTGADGINFQQASDCGYAAFGMDIIDKQWVATIQPAWLALRVLHAYVGKGVSRLAQVPIKENDKCKAWPARDTKTGEIRIISINKNLGKGCTVKLTFNNRWVNVARTKLLLGSSLNAGVADITYAGQRYTKFSGGIPKGTERIIANNGIKDGAGTRFEVYIPPAAVGLTILGRR